MCVCVCVCVCVCECVYVYVSACVCACVHLGVWWYACARISEQMWQISMLFNNVASIFNQLEYPENCCFVVDTRPRIDPKLISRL